MKIIEASKREVKCAFCKSILIIEPMDISYDIVYSSVHAYYYCLACGAKNYSVPEEYKKGQEDTYRRLHKFY